MRLDLVPNLETRDGVAQKDPNLSNTLVEQGTSGRMVSVRPGLALQANTTGRGNGLVSFNNKLLSVYGSTLGKPALSPDSVTIYNTYGAFFSMRHINRYGTYFVGNETISSSEYGLYVDIDSGTRHIAGYLAGQTSTRLDCVTDDGQTAYGFSGNFAISWSVSGGTVDLGFPSGCRVLKCSPNGDTLIGTQSLGFGNSIVWRWTSGTGWVNLSALFAVQPKTTTFDLISEDCSALVLGGVTPQGFWSVATGPLTIPSNQYAICISGDGSVCYGYDQTANQQMFYWTPSGGSVMVPFGNGFLSDTFPNAASYDGRVVCGEGYIDIDGYYSHGFRWTLDTGFIDLTPDLAFGLSSYGSGVSRDGTTCTGFLETVENVDCAYISADRFNGLVVLDPRPAGTELRSQSPFINDTGNRIVARLDTAADFQIPVIYEIAQTRPIVALTDSFFDSAQSTL